jgi:hypothetical protein
MRAFLASLIVLYVAGSPSVFAEDLVTPAYFSHPGIFTSQSELETIQARVHAADPNVAIYQGWLSTMKSKFDDLNYTPHPIPFPTRHDRKPQDSCVDERNSAMVAYTLTLKWAVTGDIAARDKAQQLMADWADVFKTHVGDDNTYLDSSWVITVWCAAGELMRYGKVDGHVANWPADQQEKFNQMIRNLEAKSSIIITKPFNPGSNWGTSSMLGDMAAGVFLDDPKMYARGRNAMLKYMPHILTRGGWANEVFRDAWHGTVALTGTLQAAEVGRHQGDLSIYHVKFDGQDEPRVVVCLKWYANPLRGIPVDMPPMGGARWKPKPWQFVGTPNTARSTGGFEMALNFYTCIEPTPGLEAFRDAVMKSYRPSGQDNSLFIESDTLTHGDLDKR